MLPILGNNTSIKLILTMSILAASAGLVGGTVTNSSSLTQNPSSFVAGTLVLSNTVESGVPCTSTAANLACQRIVDGTLKAGEVVSSRVTLQNIGVVPVDQLAFWVADCQSSDSSAVGFHGSASLCGVTQVTLHDDTHDTCFYPTVGPGACTFAPGGSVNDLLGRHNRGTPVLLSPDHLGGGITYTIAMRFGSDLGNDSQGRQETIGLVFQASQG